MLAQSIPSVVGANPLKTSTSPFLSVSAQLSSTTGTWPKSSDFSIEELQTMFWHKSAWTEHQDSVKGTSLVGKKGARGRTRAAEGVNVQMLYVVDQEGTPIDGHRASAVRATARSIWAQLSDAGLAPMKWMSNKNLTVSDHYRSEMGQRFEEFRLCENGWKADQVAIDYYPAWRTSQQANRTFNGNKENEILEVGSSSDDESDNNDSNGNTSKKRKLPLKTLHQPKKQKRNDMTATREKKMVQVCRLNAISSWIALTINKTSSSSILCQYPHLFIFPS